MVGFAVALAAGACVLLSAPLFGTAWAGPYAAVAPVAAGVISGGGPFGWRRYRFLRGRDALDRALAAMGRRAGRPTARGLDAYYDAQLLLLRCEYDYVLSRRTRRPVGERRAARSARLLEQTFGFTPEDGFECGPLNVRPDTEEMRAQRGRWEGRLAARRALGEKLPSLGLREDRAYRVFPREMTVPVELATRAAYLSISLGFFKERYGEVTPLLSDDLRRRAEREMEEYRALAGR